MNERYKKLKDIARRHRLDQVLVFGLANIKAFSGVESDNACLTLDAIYTDFRYVPMVHRVAPWLKVRDMTKLGAKGRKAAPKRIGYEAAIPHARYLELKKQFPGATFVDITRDLENERAVKTADEQTRLRAAVALNDEIWAEARRQFKPGMTELDMARIIRVLMITKGEGEAFDTIVCVGKNAAECHHVPDETVWNGREPLLVDMGVRLGGICSDMTRCIPPKRRDATYQKVYDLVLKANLAAIAAARPGMTGKQLDKVARDVITKGGFGKCFGHSLGHGVGLEIHEQPYASQKTGDMVLRPGMSVTIEPGIYLEGDLGVRIEDLILITETGCEVLTATAK